MNAQRNLVLSGLHQRPILFDLFTPEDRNGSPVVIFCHGYKGFKDWGAWDLVARAFVQSGFVFCKFNFSHNGGTIEQPIDFPDLEAFALNNYSIELDDLKCMIDHITAQFDPPEVLLIGHSRGGGIVSIKAEEDSRVRKVVSWAGVSDFEARFLKGTKAFELWRERGITHIENARTGQQLPHYFQFYENFAANADRLTIKRAVSVLTIPHLIVHGSEDPTVPLPEAKALNSWNPNSHLEIIAGADHVFGASHPWSDDELPDHLREVVEKTLQFLA